jgi:hypothetical protein
LPLILAPVTFLEALPRIMPLCFKMAYTPLYELLEIKIKLAFCS